MKKNWLNPQLNELGVSLTKDDTIVACPEETTDGLIYRPGKPDDKPESRKCAIPGCDHKAAPSSDKCPCHKNTTVPTVPTEPGAPTQS